MKNLKKTVTSFAVSAIIASVAIVGYASAAEKPAVKESPNTVEVRFIEPTEFGNKWDGTVTASSSTQSSFSVPSTYGHVKMWFNNKDSKAVTISITHESGKVYVTKTIPGNSPYTWKSLVDDPDGVRSGKYTVQYHSPEGSVNVEYNGFASNNKDEV
ncbi:hypothetical protein YDYSY3_04050 [Paenibacillus chitinolyticus]|uniref:hypothetical protein n=1 Tax=Paenibacillus chitinolyticus TaxID=79263 RepID=UPI0026E4D90B|nr:hypothetical protein [Paenibacillus chitinolyticus]GKS09405.1 hypothetical protein YDYSY3_04050 [Paenibacillus chitinolyticus]